MTSIKPTQSYSQFYNTEQLDGLSALDAVIYQQSFPKHYHDTYQVTLSKCGVFTNQINGKLINALKNHISITHPGEVHATICDEKTGHSFFTLYLPPSLFKYKLKANDLGQAHFNSVVSDQQLAQLLHKIQYHLANKSPSIELITWRIVDRLVHYHQSSKVVKPEAHSHFDLTQLSTYESKFCLDSWARKFGLNKFKFIRLFKTQTGMTPNQYLIFQRIKHSKSLLAHGSDLTHTALDCGFYDLPHFHKHFKKIIGVTPLAFQQAHTDKS